VGIIAWPICVYNLTNRSEDQELGQSELTWNSKPENFIVAETPSSPAAAHSHAAPDCVRDGHEHLVLPKTRRQRIAKIFARCLILIQSQSRRYFRFHLNARRDATNGHEQTGGSAPRKTLASPSISPSHEAPDKTDDGYEHLARLRNQQHSLRYARLASSSVWKIVAQPASYSATDSDGGRPYNGEKDQSKRCLASAETDSHFSRRRMWRLVQFTYIYIAFLLI
jgi:hypothetical protein